jgi:uncharacterized protein YtpQ (UPF0354 family)
VRAVLSWAVLLAVIAALSGCNDKKSPSSGPLTIADFKGKAAAAVTIQSDLEGKPGFGAKVDVSSTTSLNTFSQSVQTSYAEYRKDPENVDSVLKKFVDSVQARMSRGNEGVPFQDARARVLPILKPKMSFRRVTDDPATTAFPGDLRVAYAVQEPDSFILVSRADLGRWHKSIGEISNLAQANLLKETEREQPLRCEQKLCGWASGDGYDAARFIVPELRAEIVKKIGPAVYAVPRESVYVALPVKYASRIRDKVERDFVTGTNPVSRDLFVERDGEVVVLK